MYIPVFVITQRVETILWHRLSVFSDTRVNAVQGNQAQGFCEFKSVKQNKKETEWLNWKLGESLNTPTQCSQILLTYIYSQLYLSSFLRPI